PGEHPQRTAKFSNFQNTRAGKAIATSFLGFYERRPRRWSLTCRGFPSCTLTVQSKVVNATAQLAHILMATIRKTS
uniref:hypothetical protein n=1 Tax=Yoonia sp. TaxID=2212373 RepID=UPI004048D128